MRSDKAKLEFALGLIIEGKTYKQIQDALKQKFHSSISNSTIRKLHKEYLEEHSKDREIARLEKELQIFKTLYFDSQEKLEAVERKVAQLEEKIDP